MTSYVDPIVSRRFVLARLVAGSLGVALLIRERDAFAQDPATDGTSQRIDELRFDLSVTKPVLPAGPIYLWSTMYAIEPGVSTEYPGFAIESPVAAVVWVQSGMLSIEGELGAAHIETRPSTNASPAADSMLLGPGDAIALELGPDHTYQLRNAGEDTLVFAEFWLVGGPRPSYPFPPGYLILDFYHDPSAVNLPSASTATMHLSRMPLAPGETLPVPDGGWQMALTENPASISRSWPGGAPTNFGVDPITIVVMTADFQAVAGTSTTGGG